MYHLYKILLIVMSGMLLGSCFTSVARVDEDSAELGLSQGYLVVGFVSNYRIRRIFIDGDYDIQIGPEHLDRVDECLVFPMKAGEYHLSSIWISRRHYFSLAKYGDEKDLWKFNIEAGKINYLGHLMVNLKGVDSLYTDNRADIEVVNRASFSFECLEKNYSSILQEREVVYARPEKDPLFDVYNTLWRKEKQNVTD